MSSLDKKAKIVGSKHIKLSLIVADLEPFKIETGVSTDRDSSAEVIDVHALGTDGAIAVVGGSVSHAGGFSLQQGEYDDLILYIKSIDFSFNTLLDLSEIDITLVSFDSWQSITTLYNGVTFSKESSSSERKTHESTVNISFSCREIKRIFPLA